MSSQSKKAGPSLVFLARRRRRGRRAAASPASCFADEKTPPETVTGCQPAAAILVPSRDWIGAPRLSVIQEQPRWWRPAASRWGPKCNSMPLSGRRSWSWFVFSSLLAQAPTDFNRARRLQAGFKTSTSRPQVERQLATKPHGRERI